MQSTLPRLIVGLGNPGPEYEETRHNIGFTVVDSILAGLPGKGGESTHTANSLIWAVRFAGHLLWLQKPLTYMNLSGAAVAKVARAEGLLPEEILVIYDDLDLPLGRLRMREQGSSGGHRGVESLIGNLESSAFARLRLGIGRATDGMTVDYVLERFDASEANLLEIVVKTATDAVLLATRRGVQTAMNQFNGLDLASGEDEPQDNSTNDS